MDEARKREIRDVVKKEFRLGRAKLFRVEVENKVRAELAQDRELLFAAFKEFGVQRQLELTQTLGRLLMAYSKLASYRGVLEGYHLFQAGIKLGEDRSRYYLVLYLQNHPSATNRDMINHLDAKNHRLLALRTSEDDPLWAWLPRSWKEKLESQGIRCYPGEFWEAALERLPDLVMPYLSRAKRMAKQPRVKNTLFSWPRIIKEHRKRRKNRKNRSKTESHPDT